MTGHMTSHPQSEHGCCCIPPSQLLTLACGSSLTRTIHLSLGRRGNRGRGLNKEYMNVSSAVRDDSESSCSDINYADLDFSVADLSTEAPTLLLREKSTSSDTEGKNSDIEYVMINIVATEAARKASEEHRKYRLNRHTVRAH